MVVPYELNDTSGGLGLYATDQFTSADAIVDFVQYGAAGSARENVAVVAGIWKEGEFVQPVRLPSYSIAYDGEGNAASDWSEVINPTFGMGNETPTLIVLPK